MTPASRDRRVALAWGASAERLAAWLLRAKGFRILDLRYRLRDGEIDLVARRGRLVVFVEVKARATLAEAMAAVTPAKRRRMSRAARAWIAAHPQAAGCSFRCDGVFFAGFRPRHVAGLLELDLGMA